ncbi:Protein slowmo, partial [Trichinella britovi]
LKRKVCSGIQEMKIWLSEHVFEHDWDTVVKAAWRKYPNPLKPEVTGIDIVNRELGPDGILRTDRVIRTEWRVPSWATKLIGLKNPSYAHEYSEVDTQSKRMLLRSQNLNCRNFVCVEETLKYVPHPTEANKTLMTQAASISVYGVPLISYMENMLVNMFRFNSQKGCQAMEWVINNIKREYEEISNKMNGDYKPFVSPALEA